MTVDRTTTDIEVKANICEHNYDDDYDDFDDYDDYDDYGDYDDNDDYDGDYEDGKYL